MPIVIGQIDRRTISFKTCLSTPPQSLGGVRLNPDPTLLPEIYRCIQAEQTNKQMSSCDGRHGLSSDLASVATVCAPISERKVN